MYLQQFSPACGETKVNFCGQRELRDPRKEGRQPSDHQEADLTKFRERSHQAISTKMVPNCTHVTSSSAFVFVLCRNITAWAATTFYGIGCKAPTCCRRTLSPPTSFCFFILLWQGLTFNTISCHPVNSFPPCLQGDSSAYGGKVACGKSSGFVVAGDKTTSGKGVGKETEGTTQTSCLWTLALTTHRASRTSPQWALRSNPGLGAQRVLSFKKKERHKTISYFSQNFNVLAIIDK